MRGIPTRALSATYVGQCSRTRVSMRLLRFLRFKSLGLGTHYDRRPDAFGSIQRIGEQKLRMSQAHCVTWRGESSRKAMQGFSNGSVLSINYVESFESGIAGRAIIENGMRSP
ncbi:hypothetical protein BD310DRAFT_548984 [Dichomitus squalens]|uniref:Uncharacterized protein n=1 Tax=Dichomitus squalens TaxID=114155 RepID=A0A4Q9PSV8_9APHY|nr:hypothetical protein BD310DRAFT_548984 [Dichomitus squalens]